MPYDIAPSMRMAYDDDGTVMLFRLSASAAVERNASQKAEANDEDNVTAHSGFNWGGDTGHVIFIFPELREIDGFFTGGAPFEFGSATWGALEVSADTTNGIDGTWTTEIANIGEFGTTYPTNYRNEIVSTAANAKRAVRANKTDTGSSSWSSMHIYGTISPGETPDRLIFIDELTGLEFTLPKDFGDVPRGSAREFEWRLKNNSTVAGNNLTVNTIQFTAESLYLSSGGWYTHSVGGDAFAGTKSITSLAPEASSALITTRQIIPVNEVLGPHVARLQATHTSLS